MLEVYNADLGMKREDCEMFVGMDVDVQTQQIRLKQHIDHSPRKPQHGCTAKNYGQKYFVVAGKCCGIVCETVEHDFHKSLGQSMVHVRLVAYYSGLPSSFAMRFAKRQPCLRAGYLKAMRLLDSQ